MQACGSPQKACALLADVAKSQGVPSDVKIKAMEMINQISATQNLNGAANPQAAVQKDSIHSVASVGMEGKDKGALV